MAPALAGATLGIATFASAAIVVAGIARAAATSAPAAVALAGLALLIAGATVRRLTRGGPRQ